MSQPFSALSDSPRREFKKFLPMVKHADVFIDDRVIDVVHWNGGFSEIVANGALTIKPLSINEVPTENAQKVVFFVEHVVSEETQESISAILSRGNHLRVIVASFANNDALSIHEYGSADRGEELMEQIGDKILEEFLENKNASVEVVNLPMYHFQLAKNIFIVPESGNLFYSLQRFLAVQGVHKDRRLESLALIETLEPSSRFAFQNFVAKVNQLLEQLNVREECFCVGACSRLFASELLHFPSGKQRRKNAPSKASLIIVDRLLDLATPCSHSELTFANKVFGLLPKLATHQNDVQVNMKPLFAPNSACVNLPPGCVGHRGNEKCAQILDLFFLSKQKECLIELNRHLIEVVSKEGLSQKVAKFNRVTTEVVLSHLELLKSNFTTLERHCALLETVMAAIEAMSADKQTNFDKLMSLEKLIVQGLGEDDNTGPVPLIARTVQEEGKGWNVKDILALLVHVYSLCGSDVWFSAEEEGQLKKILEHSISELKQSNVDKHLHRTEVSAGITNRSDSQRIETRLLDDNAEKSVEKIFKRLKLIRTMRDSMKALRSLYKSGSGVQPTVFSPILQQIVEASCDPSFADHPDIEYKSDEGLKAMLKSGFSLFVSVNKPKPCDNPLLIVLVLGGVTADEVKMMKDAAAAAKLPEQQVLFVSNQILSPSDIVLDLLLGQDSHFL